jgi:uncharacterized protein YihD (DUF1040 family)
MARIIHITDAFDAMISDRPYRPGLRVEDALLELKNNAGSQFDPKLVKSFIPIIIQQYKLEFSRKEEVAEKLMKDPQKDFITTLESGMVKFAEQFWIYVDRLKDFFTRPPQPFPSRAVELGEDDEMMEELDEDMPGAPGIAPPSTSFPQYPGTLPPPPDI